jgi:glyoxylase-like metal-dependent hydrolase (beta-lactamase superfamily II)/rhodanese-related sulfurtransferase
MKIEQIYTECLAEASYFIESNGEAVIIDPIRETQPYLDKLEKEGAVLKYIFETHFHADFVSGHLDLSKKTGAPIIFGPNSNPDFDVNQKEDGDILSVGKVKFKVLHTPGHTLESSCYLLMDEADKETAIFTGDTLFIGDVGRPDLAINNGLTKEDLAKKMYHSLRTKIMVLPDDVTVYPAHGAGSACGKNMSSETYDSLGNQKRNNYALRADMTETEFVEEVLDGIAPAPGYFSLNAMLNKSGYDSITEVVQKGLTPLTVSDFEKLGGQEDVIIIDTRHQNDFHKGFVPGSLFFGLNGTFAPWVGSVLKDVKTKIVFIADDGKEEEVVTRLARVGFDNVLGYLEGGIEAWRNENKDLDQIESVDSDGLAHKMAAEDVALIDVRKPGENETSSVENVENYPLDFISDNIAELDKSKKYYIHCRSGYRSMIYASMLRKHGFPTPVDVAGGFNALSQHEGFKIVNGASCSLS